MEESKCIDHIDTNQQSLHNQNNKSSQSRSRLTVPKLDFSQLNKPKSDEEQQSHKEDIKIANEMIQSKVSKPISQTSEKEKLVVKSALVK